MKITEHIITIRPRKCIPRDLKHIDVKVLDIGCGNNKTLGSIGLDMIKHKGVDIVHDLTKFPYPIKNNEFDVVIANHILEHIQLDTDLLKLMKEIHRILKPNGLFEIEVPYKKGRFSSSLFGHSRFFMIGYFDYFRDMNLDVPHLLNKKGSYFDVVEQEFKWITGLSFLNFLKPLYNLYHPFSELVLTNIIPPDVIKFELRCDK